MKVLSTTFILVMLFIATNQALVNGDRDLFSQLMDFKTLIPQSKLRYIVNKHYSQDAQFRHAIQYITTPEFEKVMEMIQKSSSYQQVINYLQSSGVNTTSIEDISANIHLMLTQLTESDASAAPKPDNVKEKENNVRTKEDIVKRKVDNFGIKNDFIKTADSYIGTKEDNVRAKDDNVKPLGNTVGPNILRPFYYDLMDSDEDEDSSEEMSSYRSRSSRSMQSFGNEIAKSIPRGAFREMVEEKMQVNSEFAKFYAAVNSKDFRRLILSTMRSKELDEPLRILKKNGINVRSQSMTAMKVISWGPRIN